jgi:NADH-quinone oxidoreductase subunit G
VNPEVNGHWMCDVGRNTYKYVNLKARLLSGKVGKRDVWQEVSVEDAVRSAGQKLRESKPEEIAVVVTGQYTNEEYASLFKFFREDLKAKSFFHWQNLPHAVNEFDGLLFRGDRNPNTKGLENAFSTFGGKSNWDDLQAGLSGRKFKTVVVFGPEDQSVFPDLDEKIKMFSAAENLIWLTACWNKSLDNVGGETWQIPLKTYIEKSGSFTNFQGKVQGFKAGTTIVPQALTVTEAVELMAGREINWNLRPKGVGGPKTNYAIANRGQL